MREEIANDDWLLFMSFQWIWQLGANDCMLGANDCMLGAVKKSAHSFISKALVLR